MKVTLVVGARPNFMKAAPVLEALRTHQGVGVELVHTGQHYDERMSDSFLRDLGIPLPDVQLEVGSGSHATQTAEVLVRFESYLSDARPDLVMVVGDVNSTVAAALAAVKLHIPVAHVESGLRSRDRNMPEEINRVLTDSMAALLFVTEQAGLDNLRAEGVAEARCFLVGNTMIDTLLRHRGVVADRPAPPDLPERFGLVTLHRPSNVDTAETLGGILGALEDISRELPLCWPVHPRTEGRLDQFGLRARLDACPAIQRLPPCGYLDFLALMQRSRLILTDSGGIQEEALVLRVPVVTLRENTERPSTLECGGNLLAGSDPDQVRAAARTMLARDPASFSVPPLWDGRSGQRIAAIVVESLERGLAL